MCLSIYEEVIMKKLKATESNTATGDCSFNRELEQKIIRDVQQLLTNQRHMDESSIAIETGCQSEEQGKCGHIVVNIIQVRSFGAELLERLDSELYRHREFRALLKNCLSFILMLLS
jgi:hypothetical protein